FRSGLATDERLRPLDDTGLAPFENLFAAGSVLGGYNYAGPCGFGGPPPPSPAACAGGSPRASGADPMRPELEKIVGAAAVDERPVRDLWPAQTMAERAGRSPIGFSWSGRQAVSRWRRSSVGRRPTR